MVLSDEDFRRANVEAAKTVGIQAFVDMKDENALADALAQRPALVWIETPSNPLLRIADIAAISAEAHWI